VPPPPELARRIAAAVRHAELESEPDRRVLPAAAAVACVSAAAAFAIQRNLPGALFEAVSRIGLAAARLLAVSPEPGAFSALASAWSRLTTWLAEPSVLGSGVALLATLIVLQIGGSAALLMGRRREDRP
jgi:hypothetical protein